MDQEQTSRTDLYKYLRRVYPEDKQWDEFPLKFMSENTICWLGKDAFVVTDEILWRTVKDEYQLAGWAPWFKLSQSPATGIVWYGVHL